MAKKASTTGDTQHYSPETENALPTLRTAVVTLTRLGHSRDEIHTWVDTMGDYADTKIADEEAAQEKSGKPAKKKKGKTK